MEAFSKRKPGDRFEIKADEFNAMLEAGKAFKQGRFNAPSQNTNIPGGSGNKITVLAENISGSDIDRGDALYITDIIFTHEDNAQQFEYFPSFKVSLTKAAEGNTPALALEPIASGKIGSVMLTGYLAVQITVSSASHNYATFSGSSDGTLISADTGEFKILWKETGTGSLWTVLFIGAGGAASSGIDIYLCKITGGSTAAGYTVDIYGNGYDAEKTGTGTLQVLDLAQSDDLTTGTRVLGHSASLTITGGSEA